MTWQPLPGYSMLKIINISPEEEISASNGTELEGKRIQSGEGREDGARRRLCIIKVEALVFLEYPAAQEQFRQQNDTYLFSDLRYRSKCKVYFSVLCRIETPFQYHKRC